MDWPVFREGASAGEGKMSYIRGAATLHLPTREPPLSVVFRQDVLEANQTRPTCQLSTPLN